MTEIEKKDDDVEEVVTPDDKSKADEDDDDIDDKGKNFASLRKKSEALEKENTELKKQLESKGSENRSLGEEDDEDKDKGKEKKSEKKSDSDPLEIVFKRDLKEA